MVTIDIKDPDRGEPQIFPDDAAAIVWLQDEIGRWEKAFGLKLKDSSGAFAEPLRAWRQVKDDIDGLRRRNKNKSYEYQEDDYNDNFVLINSNVGRSLLFVLNKLGEASADSAAISARLSTGEVDWADNASFRGIILFERMKRADVEFNAAERDRIAGIRAASAVDQIEVLTGSIAKLDQMVSSIAGTAAQQRAQADAEIQTFKEGTIANWREFSGQAETIQADIRLSISDSDDLLTTATANAQGRIDTWIAAHDEQRQLEKPAQLWAERSSKHIQNSDKWRNWSVGVGIGGLALAVFIAVRAFQWSRPLFEAAVLPGSTASLKATAGTLRPTFHYELIFTGAITLGWLTMYL